MQNNSLNQKQLAQNHNFNLHNKEPIHQYFVQSQTMSPKKRSSLKVDGHFSSHQKYDKFCPKLQLLQMNLNRLYGQHQTIKPLIQNFQQISNQLLKLSSIQTIKKNFQSLRIQYLISKTKTEAKRKIFFNQTKQKIQKLQNDIIFVQSKYSSLMQSQKQKQKQYEQSDIHLRERQTFLKFKVLVQNKKKFAFQFINNVQANLKKYYENASKNQVHQYFTQIKADQLNKITLLKEKIGQLQCITEYSKYVKNANKFQTKAKQLENSNLTIEQKLNQIGQLQLVVFKDERTQIFNQNKERIMYQITLLQKKVKTLPERKEFMDAKNIDALKEELIERVTKIKYESKGLQQFVRSSIKKQKKLQTKLEKLSINKSLQQQLSHKEKNCEQFIEQLLYLESLIKAQEFNSKI